MKKRRLVALPIAILLTMACASSGPPVPPAQVTETEAAIRSAENAGASVGASELLDRSRRALAAARQASTQGNNEEAARQIAEAKAFAAAAEARARAESMKRRAAEARQQADELESKAKQLQERARPSIQ
jgi:hypothetical protein